MASLIVLSLVAVSAVGAWLLGRHSARREPASLRAALGFTLGSVGAAVGFFAVNVALGLTAGLILRAFAPPLVTLYPLTDPTLVLLSALEGLAFHAWWTARR